MAMFNCMPSAEDDGSGEPITLKISFSGSLITTMAPLRAVSKLSESKFRHKISRRFLDKSASKVSGQLLPHCKFKVLASKARSELLFGAVNERLVVFQA